MNQNLAKYTIYSVGFLGISALIWNFILRVYLYYCSDPVPILSFLPPFTHNIWNDMPSDSYFLGTNDYYILDPWIVYSLWAYLVFISFLIPFYLVFVKKFQLRNFLLLHAVFIIIPIFFFTIFYQNKNKVYESTTSSTLTQYDDPQVTCPTKKVQWSKDEFIIHQDDQKQIVMVVGKRNIEEAETIYEVYPNQSYCRLMLPRYGGKPTKNNQEPLTVEEIYYPDGIQIIFEIREGIKRQNISPANLALSFVINDTKDDYFDLDKALQNYADNMVYKKNDKGFYVLYYQDPDRIHTVEELQKIPLLERYPYTYFFLGLPHYDKPLYPSTQLGFMSKDQGKTWTVFEIPSKKGTTMETP